MNDKPLLVIVDTELQTYNAYKKEMEIEAPLSSESIVSLSANYKNGKVYGMVLPKTLAAATEDVCTECHTTILIIDENGANKCGIISGFKFNFHFMDGTDQVWTKGIPLFMTFKPDTEMTVWMFNGEEPHWSYQDDQEDYIKDDGGHVFGLTIPDISCDESLKKLTYT